MSIDSCGRSSVSFSERLGRKYLDKSVLEIIREGHKLEFVEKPKFEGLKIK